MFLGELKLLHRVTAPRPAFLHALRGESCPRSRLAGLPGSNLLVDGIDRSFQGRAAGIYTSSCAAGSAGWFLPAGPVDAAFGWRANFVAAGIGPLLSGVSGTGGSSSAPARRRTTWAISRARRGTDPCTTRRKPWGIGRRRRRSGASRRLRDFTMTDEPKSLDALLFELPTVKRANKVKALLRNRALLAHVAAFAGNTGEVFAVRVWFVTYLAWLLRPPGNRMALPPLGLVSGVAGRCSSAARAARRAVRRDANAAERGPTSGRRDFRDGGSAVNRDFSRPARTEQGPARRVRAAARQGPRRDEETGGATTLCSRVGRRSRLRGCSRAAIKSAGESWAATLASLPLLLP